MLSESAAELLQACPVVSIEALADLWADVREVERIGHHELRGRYIAYRYVVSTIETRPDIVT